MIVYKSFVSSGFRPFLPIFGRKGEQKWGSGQLTNVKEIHLFIEYNIDKRYAFTDFKRFWRL